MKGIFGIGTDLIQNSRIKRIIENKGIQERFLKKVLHISEIERFNSLKDIQSKSIFVASR